MQALVSHPKTNPKSENQMLQPEIITALDSLKTQSEIAEAWHYLRHKSQQLSMQLVDKFRPGQRVQFTDKRGITLRGSVRSLNRRTVSVEVQDPFLGPVTWRVSARLLTEVTASVFTSTTED